MGFNADKTLEFFSGPLGLRSWLPNPHAKPIPGIANPAVREFVLGVADKLCGDYFWSRPAATNNAYHPMVSCGEGGLVRHVQYACYWGYEMCRSMDVYPEGSDGWSNTPTVNHDVVLGALILHDMMKEGDPTRAQEPERAKKGYITGCHGVDLAEAILTRYLTKPPERWQILIVMGIAGHMGVWTKPERYNPQKFQDPHVRHVALIVHAADYASSRKADGVMASVTSGIRYEPEINVNVPATPAPAPVAAGV